MLKIHKNQSLAVFTTFKTGGPADYFARVRDVEELLEAVNISKKMKIPFLVIGGGSNVLVGDHGFRGMVIKNEMNKISLMGAKGSYGKKNRPFFALFIWPAKCSKCNSLDNCCRNCWTFMDGR